MEVFYKSITHLTSVYEALPLQVLTYAPFTTCPQITALSSSFTSLQLFKPSQFIIPMLHAVMLYEYFPYHNFKVLFHGN